MLPGASKDALRQSILEQRRALSGAEWAAEDAAHTLHLVTALGGTPSTVALYASRPGEPGTQAAITRLHDAGWAVLLPRLGRTPDWALFDGWERMRRGWAGIPEPTTPGLGADALAGAQVVIVACLAVARDGPRVGTGGGWYDRALPRRDVGARVWALARTVELRGWVPSERHDIPVDGVITADGMFACGEATLPGIGKPWPPELS